MKTLLSQGPGSRTRGLGIHFAFLVLAAMVAPAKAQESVTAVRFWSLNDVTRVAIETTGQFEFRSDKLENPDRVFFDLPGIRPQLGRKGLSTIAVGDHLLRQIRVAETQRGTTRVVLDLACEVEVSTSQLDNPDRLIIELRKPGTRLTTAVMGKVASAPPFVERAVPERTFVPPAPRKNSSEHNYALPSPLDPPGVDAARLNSGYASKNDPLSRIAQRPHPLPYENPKMPRGTPAQTSLASVTIPPSTPVQTPVQTPVPAPVETGPERVGLPAKHNGMRDESMIRALGLKVGRVVIDAGHGGHDVGSIGPGGLLEKDLVLDVARRVGALIEQHLGWEVVYTRSDDTYVPLEQRTEIANSKHADLFLSIHANSSNVRTAAGVETYYLNFTTSKAALDVAARENASSEKTIFELQDLLQKIALRDKVDESREFAARIQSSLDSMSARNTAHPRDRGVRKAPFVVLIGASMPSVLAEIGFISNPRDESMMKRSEYRQKIAEALYKGVASYGSTLSHFQVAQTRVQ